MSLDVLKQDETLLNGAKAGLAALAGCSNTGIIAVGIVPIKGEETRVRVTVFGADTHEATKRARHLNRDFDQEAGNLGLGTLSKRPEFKAVATQTAASAACHVHG